MSDPNAYPPVPPSTPGQPAGSGYQPPQYMPPEQPVAPPQPPMAPPAPGYAAPGQPSAGQAYPGQPDPGYAAPGYPAPPAYTPPAGSEEGTKSFVATWLLSLILGGFGADRFYLGKIGTAIAKLLTAGGLGVWAMVDLIIILCGGMRDKQGFKLRGYVKYRLTAWLVTAGLWLISIIGSVITWIAVGATLLAGSASLAVTANSLDELQDALPEDIVSELPSDVNDLPDDLSDQIDDLLNDLPDDLTEDLPGGDDATGDVAVSDDKDAALADARIFAEQSEMSKQGTYDLLTSEYIDHYSDDAAQYAIDNLDNVDWNANALSRAQSFAEGTTLSEQGVWEMLAGEYGAGFTSDEADYAMKNLGDVDWNANAVDAAKLYQENFDYDLEQIRDSLVTYDGFTQDQADYAVEHLS